MNLVATAETAQDVASGLNKFLIPVEESSSEITGLISECFAISSLLRDIAAIRDSRQSNNYSNISDDLCVAVSSIEYTFDDVHRFCGQIVRTSSSAYRDVWRRIESHFLGESRNSLLTRLAYYKRFLEDLRLILEDGEPQDWDVYDDHQLRIDALLEVQESRIEDDFSGLSLGAAGTSRQRSFERRRPRLSRTSAESHSVERSHRPSFPQRGSRVRLSRPQTPISPLDDDSDDWVPSAPDPPRSPTTTATFSHSSSSSSSNSHWAVKVFEQSRSTTDFLHSGSVSICYGQDMPGASSQLAEDYTKILELPFENGELFVRLYVRNRDQRGRMYCRTFRSGKTRKQSCLPLSMLRVEKHVSSLKFYRLSSSGNSSEIWATLRFSSYEKLVLFFCTFRAMRAEESGASARQIQDYELRGETEIFGGKIRNEYGEQALRLYKDRDSDGIRMEAAVLRGQLKRKPVWTAFITHHVFSNRWMRKIDSRTIQLAELQRYIFKSDYDAQIDPDEQNNLSFVNSSATALSAWHKRLKPLLYRRERILFYSS